MLVRVTFWWDELLVGEQIISTDEMNFGDAVIRLDPTDPAIGSFGRVAHRLWESTYLRIKFERVDSAGRKLTR